MKGQFYATIPVLKSPLEEIVNDTEKLKTLCKELLNGADNGNFSAECRNISFGSKSYWLDTHDPEEAIYLAEMYLLNWAQIRKEHYSKIERKLNNHDYNNK